MIDGGRSGQPVGALVTLAELKALGRFVRWQEIDAAVAPLIEPHRLFAYPLLPSRLPSEPTIDICIDGIWHRTSSFLPEWSGFNLRLLYEHRSRSGDIRCPAGRPWFDVAPAGHFTDRLVLEPPGFELQTAEIVGETFCPRHRDHVIANQRIVDMRWPYLTFEVATCHPARGFCPREGQREIRTYHVADPRIRVPGIIAVPPRFNAPIAVSHRWLTAADPDPNGVQLGELICIAEQLRLHDRQAFLIDYCALPQIPRSDEDAAMFDRDWPGFQRSFCGDIVVLNTGSAGYATRAWCMLELLSATLGGSNGGVVNRARLDAPLREALQQAAGFVQNRAYLRGATNLPPPGGDARQLLADLQSDPYKLMIYQATLDARAAVQDRFASLALRHEDDRGLVDQMLAELLGVSLVKA